MFIPGYVVCILIRFRMNIVQAEDERTENESDANEIIPANKSTNIASRHVCDGAAENVIKQNIAHLNKFICMKRARQFASRHHTCPYPTTTLAFTSVFQRGKQYVNMVARRPGCWSPRIPFVIFLLFMNANCIFRLISNIHIHHIMCGIACSPRYHVSSDIIQLKSSRHSLDNMDSYPLPESRVWPTNICGRCLRGDFFHDFGWRTRMNNNCAII